MGDALPEAGEASPAVAPFGDRLAAAVAARESQIVLGLDPDPVRLWPAARAGMEESSARLARTLADVERAAGLDSAEAGRMTGRDAAGPVGNDIGGAPRGARLEAGAAVLAHCLAVIDAVGPACVAVKPQLACFERLGFAGWLALESLTAHAAAQGLLVLADGKRGDVPVTAAAYAQGLLGATPTPFGRAPGLGADAATVNPLLGRDAIEPLVASARATGTGLFVLVRTSNPGAADLFDLALADGGALWERIAALVAELGVPGPASGLASVGAVTGATAPKHLERMRELMPRAPFLLPGVGAQGGDVAALAPAFAPGRAAGLVTASRSIVNAHESAVGTPSAAARAEAERLRAQAWTLA